MYSENTDSKILSVSEKQTASHLKLIAGCCCSQELFPQVTFITSIHSAVDHKIQLVWNIFYAKLLIGKQELTKKNNGEDFMNCTVLLYSLRAKAKVSPGLQPRFKDAFA